jgi:Adenylate and Guanylate cyclase catalytic domain
VHRKVVTVHEDDALRACRTAVEKREAFPELGVEGRIGVDTGEVVTGTEERLATGDAVNVAARLQQAAEPGEVLIGEATLDLVRGAVEAEALGPLGLKGKSTPVAAFRLESVRETPERSQESPFIGRDRELSLVGEAWARAQGELRCELVTIVGEPVVGKSRLVAEGLSRIDPKTVGGRCLPYGEGITYWPVVEVLKQLDTLPSDPGAAAAIRSLLDEQAVDALIGGLPSSLSGRVSSSDLRRRRRAGGSLPVDRDVDLAITFHNDEPERAAAICDAAGDRALAGGDERGEGPRPADEALRTLDELLPDPSEPLDLLKRACLLAMLGRFEEASTFSGRAAERLRELGASRFEVWFAELTALAGDYEEAAREGRLAVDDFARRGHRVFQGYYAAKLGRWLCALGRFDEAEPLAALGRTVESQEAEWSWRQVQARVHAHRGEQLEAQRLAREAVAIVERTDQLTLQGDALCDLAEVLAAADHSDEAAEALEQALERYERKKNLAMVAQVRPRLAEIRAGAPS